jgi:hypothetical protein
MLPSPDHDRRNAEPGAGRVVVEQPEDAVFAVPEPDLLLELAECGTCGVFPLVDPASWKRPLPAVILETLYAARDHETRLARGIRNHGQRDRRRPKPRPRLRRSLMRIEVPPNPRAQTIIGPKHHPI